MSEQPDIIIMLRESERWHESQGRPYSASVERDAIAEIERLRAASAAGPELASGRDPIGNTNAMKSALRKFVTHYPMGINPFLDEACDIARRALPPLPTYGGEEE